MSTKYNIIFTKLSKNELEEIYFDIFKICKDIKLTENFINGIENKIKNLADFPESYPLIKDSIFNDSNYRMMPFKNFIIFYKVDIQNRKIIIESIINSKRNYKKILKNMK